MTETTAPSNKYEMIDDILDSWDIASHVKDDAVINDIKEAMYECYMSGCMHGGMDKDEFERGLDFFNVDVAE